METPENGKFQHLVDHCFDIFELFEKSEYRAEKIKESAEAHTVYEQKAPEATFPWKGASNLVLPLTTITIDNVEPRLVAGLTGKKPILSLSDQGEGPKVIEKWFNDELDETVKIENVARSVVHTILLEGTYYSIPEYKIEEKVRRDFVFGQDGQIIIDPDEESEGYGKPITKDITNAGFEGGRIELVPYEDVYCADDLGTIEEWEDADKIRIVRPTYGELMRKQDDMGYFNIGPWLIPDKKKRKMMEADKTAAQKIADVDISGKGVIECLECHISFFTENIMSDTEPDEDKQLDFTEERFIVTIAKDSKIIIRLVLQRDLNMNNESLIKRVRLFPEEGRSAGTGMYGKLKAIQNGASDMFNQIINIATICMIPWYFYEEGAGVKGKQEIIPGGGIKVDRTDGILFPKFNINPSQYIEFINVFISLWERVGSVGDPQIGRATKGDTTATEILSVIQEGNIKHDYQSTTFKEEFLVLLRTVYDLYYQYMPYDKTIEVKGQEVPFPRQLMRRPFNFKLTGSTDSSNKLIRRKESEDLYGMLGQNPLSNPVKVLTDLLESYEKENPDDYIDPQLNQLIQIYTENPEIVEIIGQYMQQKMETVEELNEGNATQ